MARRRLVPLVLLVTGLLVLAAIASRGRPLRGGPAGPGPTAGFFDYVFTSAVLLAVLVAAVVVWALLTSPASLPPRRSGRGRLVATLLFFLGAAVVAYAISTSGFQKRLRQAQQRAQTAQTGTQAPGGSVGANGQTRNARLRWDEIAIALGLLAGLGVLAFATRTARRPPTLPRRRASQRAVSLALDESLDDLRGETDLRAAIVAAYARMERALAAVGLGRRPAEAPLEYVARALRELETSGAAARRLADLFEWAKFSQHEPEPEMRDEAIVALVAVRDELRARADEPAAVGAAAR